MTIQNSPNPSITSLNEDLSLARKKLEIYMTTLNNCAIECLNNNKQLGLDPDIIALNRHIDHLIVKIKQLERDIDTEKRKSKL